MWHKILLQDLNATKTYCSSHATPASFYVFRPLSNRAKKGFHSIRSQHTNFYYNSEALLFLFPLHVLAKTVEALIFRTRLQIT
jgi:hypothetical protein